MVVEEEKRSGYCGGSSHRVGRMRDMKCGEGGGEDLTCSSSMTLSQKTKCPDCFFHFEQGDDVSRVVLRNHCGEMYTCCRAWSDREVKMGGLERLLCFMEHAFPLVW